MYDPSEISALIFHLVCLGSLITRNGKYERDIKRRVKAGNRVNGSKEHLCVARLYRNECLYKKAFITNPMQVLKLRPEVWKVSFQYIYSAKRSIVPCSVET